MSNFFSKIRTNISQSLHYFVDFRLHEMFPLLQTFQLDVNLLISKSNASMAEKSEEAELE